MPAHTQINGSLAVVTGAGSGIGRATALALAARGARVVAADIDATTAGKTAAEVGGWSEQVDVSDAGAVEAMAARVVAAHGPPDILVNNAGVGITGRFLDVAVEDWEWIVGINLLGAVHTCKAFGAAMVERGRGQVVNISSGLAYTPRATESAYVATKAGVLALSQCLRADWHDAGVGVSVICPGIIDTNIVAGNTRFRGSRADAATRAKVVATFARGHRPELVADAVVDAITRNRSVVAVSAEARVGWWLRRLLPTAAVDRAARSRIGGL
jgi:NAD(P)-dependent dehydrogenase (short-subunit alcohol dehydrogenase family)